MPFEEGWENLPLEERLDIWLGLNKDLDKDARTTLYGFVECNKQAGWDAYLEFTCVEIKRFPVEVRERLLGGFYAVYNTSPALFELKCFNDQNDVSRN